MERIYQRVAGADVHRDSVTVAVLAAGPDGSVSKDRARFGTMSDDLAQMACWLAPHRLELVAMESTGVYWVPVYDALAERLPEVGLWLCNASHVKNVPGRKTDVADAEWLADVAMHGMVRSSFVPPRHIRDLRGLTRLRTRLVQDHTRLVQRLEQVFQQAHLKMSSVASRVYLQSTRAIIDALVAGQRDPAALADLAKSRLRSKIPDLTRALDPGGFRDAHAKALEAILPVLDELETTIADLDATIAGILEPVADRIDLVCTIPGIGIRTAQIIWAETGGDMAQFPTAGHLTAWAGVAPGSRESAGKRRRAPSRHGNRALESALCEAAASLVHSSGYLPDFQRSIAARRGIGRARIATAHKILIAVWHILDSGQPYHDLGDDHRRQRRNNTKRHNRMVHELRAAGYTITAPDAA